MGPTLRCACLTSYNKPKNNTKKIRLKLEAWSFLVESCKKDRIVAETECCCDDVAKQLL